MEAGDEARLRHGGRGWPRPAGLPRGTGGVAAVGRVGQTVTELVTRYLDGCEATERLGPKSLFDYCHYLDDYITPWIGSKLVREIDAEMIASWQIHLATEGGKKIGKGLSPTRSVWR